MLPISPRTDTLFPDTTRVRSADSQQIGTSKKRIHIGRYGQHLAQRLAAAFDGSRSPHVDDGHVGQHVLSHDLGKGAGTAIGTLVVGPHDAQAPAPFSYNRSEARRVGNECVGTCNSRWSPEH